MRASKRESDWNGRESNLNSMRSSRMSDIRLNKSI